MPQNKAALGQLASRKTIVVGISGPSSSGKTTLARLLRTVFTPESDPRPGFRDAETGVVENKDTEGADGDRKKDDEPLRVFIIHEDDFYKPDDQIPVTTTSSGKRVQDWDTLGALDIRQLVSALSYVRSRGILPPRLISKEDLNDATDSGVSEDTIRRVRDEVTRRLEAILSTKCDESSGSMPLSLAFLEGFLLYAPPDDENHPLRNVHDNIHVPLFLPATYSVMKERREGRTGYVTIGPAPTPKPDENNNNNNQSRSTKSGADGIGNIEEDGDPLPHQNFWTDPPGYVDDIVWPRYIADHQWLLLPDPGVPRNEEELKEAVGEGEHVREDVGVLVAPGKGSADMTQLLEWGVKEILRVVEGEAGPALYHSTQNSMIGVLSVDSEVKIVSSVGLDPTLNSRLRKRGDADSQQELALCKFPPIFFFCQPSNSGRYAVYSCYHSGAWEFYVHYTHNWTRKMDRLPNLPLQTAAMLILIFFGLQIHAQREDRRPLSSPDLGWRITTELGSKSAMRVVCDYGETVTKSDSYYTCCPTSAKTPCVLPTTCAGNTLLYPGEKTLDWYVHVTFKPTTAPQVNLKFTDVLIVSLWQYSETTLCGPFTGTSRTPLHPIVRIDLALFCSRPQATQSTKTDASPASTTALPHETNSESPDAPAHNSTTSSKAWIAGVVVGVIALAVLFGVLGFCIAHSKDEDMVPVNAPSIDGKEDAHSAHQAVELHNYSPAELHFDTRPVELSHYQNNVVEMPTHHDRRFVAELEGHR
ncbi:hypothetical protein ACJ72_00814 [Emergomyces africanus]|uniref:Phosphoribulokinase/uridine kinase domain-containing protein n=1 Tax=Emergomyces africanus TaxID=1955775 RepID=A0A1B7P714_9EURO|nr:hypothetical protein ACJ72_00814 [Emergomyces africanus]